MMTEQRKLQERKFVVFFVAATFGFCIWAFSPLLTGHNEPWDSEYPFYILVSLGGGVGLGLLAPRYITACYLGVWFGQVIACGVLPGLDRGWLVLGIVTTGIGSLLALIGMVIGSVIRKLIEKIEKKDANKLK
jgi:hypothetical protein